jgi:hypothetical protein
MTTGIRESFASRPTSVPYQSIPGNNDCRGFFPRRIRMISAVNLLTAECFVKAAQVIQYGAENGGIFVSQDECKALAERLRTSVDLGPLVETLAELVNQTLVAWKPEEKGNKT